MPYKIIINKNGELRLVEVPEKPSFGNAFMIDQSYNWDKHLLALGDYEQALSTALSDESKHITFKDNNAVIDLLFEPFDLPYNREESVKKNIGQTFDLPIGYSVSFEWSTCENDICLCTYFEKSDCGYTRRLAILSPESEPSSKQGGGWISVKDRLPEENYTRWIVWNTRNMEGFETEIQGFVNAFSHGVTHWHPLPPPKTL